MARPVCSPIAKAALRILLSIALICGFAPVSQAFDYPNKYVRIIIPFPPGGGSDAQARTLALELSKMWNQQVIVENKPGAGTTIGAAYVANAAPDGYTLYLNSVGHTVTPSLYKNLRYDPVKSFTPISMLSKSPFILLVNPSLGANSMADLLALARSKPGKLNYGTTGIGGGPHLAAQMMVAAAKIDAQHVPFNGSAPLLTALLENVVDFGFGDPAALPSIRAGSLKALGVTSLERSPILPDVPTFDETIKKGFDMANWSSILAPANTPPEIVKFINESIAKALKSPDLLRVFEAQGFEPVSSSPEELRNFMVAEIKKYHDVLEAAGIKPQ